MVNIRDFMAASASTGPAPDKETVAGWRGTTKRVDLSGGD